MSEHLPGGGPPDRELEALLRTYATTPEPDAEFLQRMDEKFLPTQAARTDETTRREEILARRLWRQLARVLATPVRAGGWTMRRSTVLLLILAFLVMASGTALAAGVLPVPRPLLQLYARVVGGEAPSALPEPQSQTHGELTVTLVDAVASSSQTVVELLIEHPDFPTSREEMAGVTLGPGLLVGQDLHLSGFREQEVRMRHVRREAGALRLVLELPPPASFEEPMAITMDAVPLFVETGDGRRESLTFDGPWRFEFTPQVEEAQQRQERFAVNQTATTGPIAITVGEVSLSATETVVAVHFEAPPDVAWSTLRVLELHYEGRRFDGRQLPVNGQRGGDNQLWSFPALPPGAEAFELVFNPMWYFVPDEVELALDVAQLRSGSQTALVKEHTLIFELSDSPESAGFQLAYRPADESSEHFLLGAEGDWPALADDRGNEYTLSGGNLSFDPARGFAVEEHALYTQAPLHEEATTLYFRVEETGRVTEAVRMVVEIGD
ncbi:MAG: hypothetical protein ACOCXI_15425 [Chloroflexota bacterium]